MPADAQTPQMELNKMPADAQTPLMELNQP
jgi:hypothetical protein